MIAEVAAREVGFVPTPIDSNVGPSAAQLVEVDDDPLGPARGIICSVMLAIPFWLGVAWLLFL